MRYCTNCGRKLGVGRYCTNCGARIGTSASPTAAPLPAPAAPLPSGPASYADPRRSLLPWLLGALAVLAVVGSALLVAGPSDPGGDPRSASAGQTRRGSAPVAPADVRVPGTAPPSVDADGRQVAFDAANMLDGDPRTCWRMPGDGADSSVTFTFDEPVTITEIGLVNGYAKTDPPNDWYAGNRRITAVVWSFDDGTEVHQDLGARRTLQTLDVDPVETTTVALRLLEVSDPGTGPDGRDFTAISDVAFSGTT